MELCHRYSNRSNLLGPLVNVLDKIKHGVSDGEEPGSASIRGRDAEVWRVSDRLSPADIKTLVASFVAGGTIRFLAEQHGISTTTVKRLLREHGARKQQPRMPV